MATPILAGPSSTATLSPSAGAPSFASAYTSDPFAQYANPGATPGIAPGGGMDFGSIISAIIKNAIAPKTSTKGKKQPGVNGPWSEKPGAGNPTDLATLPALGGVVTGGATSATLAAPVPDASAPAVIAGATNNAPQAFGTNAGSPQPSPAAPSYVAAPPGDPGTAAIDASSPFHKPDYWPYPTRPTPAPLPAVPTRDTNAESTSRNHAIQLAALLPFLNLVGGGGAAYGLSAANNPAAISESIAGATKNSDNAFNEAIQRYTLQNQQAQYANTQQGLDFNSQVAGVNDHNKNETELSKLGISQANANTKNAAGLVGALKELASLSSDKQRQAVIDQGLLKRFGITDPGDIATIARMYNNVQTPELIAARTKTKALQTELTEQYKIFRDPQASPEGRTAAANRIAEVQQQLGVDAAPVMNASGISPMSPFQQGQLTVGQGNLKVKQDLLPYQIQEIQNRINVSQENIRLATGKAQAEENWRQNISQYRTLKAAGVTNVATKIAQLNKSMATATNANKQAEIQKAGFAGLSDDYSKRAVKAIDMEIAANNLLWGQLNQSAYDLSQRAIQEGAAAKAPVYQPSQMPPVTIPTKQLQGGSTTPTTIKVNTRTMTGEQLNALPPAQKAAAIKELRSRMSGGG